MGDQERLEYYQRRLEMERRMVEAASTQASARIRWELASRYARIVRTTEKSPLRR